MDRLSIFTKGESEVSISQESTAVITDAVGEVANEVTLLRKGHEAGTWGEEVREMEDVDLESEE